MTSTAAVWYLSWLWRGTLCSVKDLISPPFFLCLRRWVTQQQVLREPWRVLSFCHLWDKLPRQWTWRAGTLIQFQLLTLGIRLHAFSARALRKEDPLHTHTNIIWTQSNKMKGNILYLAEDSSRWTALIWAQIWFRNSMLQKALNSKWFGSIVFAGHSRNREPGENTYISQQGAQQQSCSQISLVSN